MADVKKGKSPKDFAGALVTLLRSTVTTTYMASYQLTSSWEVSQLYAHSFINSNSTVLIHVTSRPLPKHPLHP